MSLGPVGISGVETQILPDVNEFFMRIAFVPELAFDMVALLSQRIFPSDSDLLTNDLPTNRRHST